MEIKPIRNEDDYQAALAEVKRLNNPILGSPEEDRFLILTALINAYESRNSAVSSNRAIHNPEDKQVKRLAILSQIGIALNSAIFTNENEIFLLVYEQTSKVLDVSNFFIALYHAPENTLEFSLVVERGKKITIDREWQPRKSGSGLTEYIINTKKALLISDVDAWAQKHNIDFIGQPAKCWLGVPMTLGSEVIGVIAIQNNEDARAFDYADLELLSTIAAQATIALQNARLISKTHAYTRELEKAQKHLKDAQSLAVIGLLYGEDLHLANNKLGAAAQFSLNIIEYADDMKQAKDWARRIHQNIYTVLNLIDQIRQTVNPPSPENIDVHGRLREILGEIAIPASVRIVFEQNSQDATIIGYSRQVGQVFRVVIYNAIDAMEGEGTLKIIINDHKTDGKYLRVDISDSGPGISENIQKTIFKLSPTRGKKGYGMGLAWSRLFLQMVGGDINFHTEAGIGTTMTILLPRDMKTVERSMLYDTQ